MAIIALVIGIAPNVPGFLGALGVRPASALSTSIYNWAWFVGFGLAALVYLGGMKLLTAPKAQAAHAA